MLIYSLWNRVFMKKRFPPFLLTKYQNIFLLNTLYMNPAESHFSLQICKWKSDIYGGGSIAKTTADDGTFYPVTVNVLFGNATKYPKHLFLPKLLATCEPSCAFSDRTTNLLLTLCYYRDLDQYHNNSKPTSSMVDNSISSVISSGSLWFRYRPDSSSEANSSNSTGRNYNNNYHHYNNNNYY